MRRVISIWLPLWPVERWQRAQARSAQTGAQALTPECPFALVVEAKGALKLHAVNQRAHALGLYPGMALADARARVPDIIATWAEVTADEKALFSLTQWCTRFTPWTNVDGADGLWLDVSGCAHLFGGEAALCRHILTHFQNLRLTARMGLADTPGAAWALARYGGRGISIAPEGGVQAALAPLSPAALRLNGDTVLLLKRFGLARIADLLALPRAALARRFSHKEMGEAVLARLDQALGARDEPIAPLTPPPNHRTRMAFMEPIGTLEAIAAALTSLASSLITLLEEDGMGARRLTLHGFRVDGTVARLGIGLSAPSRSLDHMLRLFTERLGELDPGFGIEAMALSANQTESLNAVQADWSKGQGESRLDQLIDRLAGRFGAMKVQRLALYDSHTPERASRLVPIGEECPPHRARHRHLPRPILIFPRPEAVEVVAEGREGPPVRFHLRRAAYPITKADGPERIALEWWRLSDDQMHKARDYYRVEDEAGRRFWLYRDGQYGQGARWYLQGLFP